MDFCAFDNKEFSASVTASCFQGQSGVREFHLMVHPTAYAGFDVQLDRVLEAYRAALGTLGLDMQTAVWRRFFCSDLVNQAGALMARPLANPCCGDETCAVSWSGQSPAAAAKVALWAYHICDPAGRLEKAQTDSSLTLRRGELAHHWTAGVACPGETSSYDQSREVLGKYEGFLDTRGLALADDVIRTWFFVRDVDANYRGLVAARRELFAARGLTAATHFIASTGIEGAGAEIAAKVTMDAYAIGGLRPGQIKFLAAPEHLSPTHVYGVTFERGVAVAYRDRVHGILSGTASIDRHGNIVHPGDVVRQLERTLENVEALLGPLGAGLRDLGVMIGYVRDPGDQAVVQECLRRRFGNAPLTVVVAPVCRPGWLVEVEGVALLPASNPHLPVF